MKLPIYQTGFACELSPTLITDQSKQVFPVWFHMAVDFLTGVAVIGSCITQTYNKTMCTSLFPQDDVYNKIHYPVPCDL